MTEQDNKILEKIKVVEISEEEPIYFPILNAAGIKVVPDKPDGEKLEGLIGDNNDLVILVSEDVKPEGYKRIRRHIEERHSPANIIIYSDKSFEYLKEKYNLKFGEVSLHPRSQGIDFLFNLIVKDQEFAEALKNSMFDSITKGYNCRFMNNAFESSVNKLSRTGELITYAFFDLKNFKVTNDVLGHHRGDEVLEGFNQVFKNCFQRNYDSFGRVGGDEFLGIMPGMDFESAHERLREGLEDLAKNENTNFSRLTKEGITEVETLKKQGYMNVSHQRVNIGLFSYDLSKLTPNIKNKLGIRVDNTTMYNTIAEKLTPQAVRETADIMMYAAKRKNQDIFEQNALFLYVDTLSFEEQANQKD